MIAKFVGKSSVFGFVFGREVGGWKLFFVVWIG
jgi:hypothetical protein